MTTTATPAILVHHHVPFTTGYIRILTQSDPHAPNGVSHIVSRQRGEVEGGHFAYNELLTEVITEAEARTLANEYWIDAIVRRDTILHNTAPAPRTVARSVPAGRYAVDVDGKLGFFKVDCPDSGRWAGYVFVKQFASDTEYPVRGARRQVILDAIAVNPQAASLRYGQEIGACGVCGRTLTDEDSRARGIGPICADKMGW